MKRLTTVLFSLLLLPPALRAAGSVPDADFELVEYNVVLAGSAAGDVTTTFQSLAASVRGIATGIDAATRRAHD